MRLCNIPMLAVYAALFLGSRADGQRAADARAAVADVPASRAPAKSVLPWLDEAGAPLAYQVAKVASDSPATNRGNHHPLIGAVIGAVVAAGGFYAVEATRQHICHFDAGTGDCGVGFPLQIAEAGLGGAVVGGIVGWFW